MERIRRSTRRRITASIACLAFVLQGFVPTLAHAIASAAHAQSYPGELCSIDPQGARLRLAQVLDAEAPAPVQSPPSAAHCPFCALPFAADAPAAIPSLWKIAQSRTTAALPIAPDDDALPRAVQRRPQAPRAPPHA